MAALLEAAAKRQGRPDLRPSTAGRVRPGRRAAAARASQASVEPLSERELEVLRLLATDLDGPDIARRARGVPAHTVRTHTKNIYAKLGVNNRRAAVRRAGSSAWLSRTRDDDRGG